MTLGRVSGLILGVLLLGLCQSEDAARPKPIIENSQECSNIVNCIVDPCQVSAECPGYPDAKCVASYCGGCYTRFVDSSGNVIEECSHQPNQRCEGGQKWNKCGSPCTKSCDTPNPVCTEVCEAKCECPPTKPIWRDGKCITEEMCLEPPPPPAKECKSNLVYNDCGSACVRPWRTCSHKEDTEAFSIAESGKKENDLVCPTVCVGRCECPKDAPVLHNRVCIPESSCPEEPEECKDWIPKCPVNPCEQHKCSSNPEATCKPYYCGGCFANFFVGEVVEECSASKETCSGGQEWSECGLACLKTCNDPDPVCTKNCVPRCQCPADKPIWKEGECVAVSQCDSSQCKSNLVFNECGSACTPSCRDPNPMCTEQCVPRCECPKELPIFHQRVCTTEEKCPEIPEPECKGGMVFEECASKCTPTCAEPDPFCTFECVAKCTCPPNTPILHNGECMPANECPETPECEGGTVWNTCGMSCTITCDDPRPMCTKECVEKCQCPRSSPFLHEGQCIPKDRCPAKGQCEHDGNVYDVGDEWNTDPCTFCSCMQNEETGEKIEMCASVKCAFPICETEVIYPKDQCCPICADPCSVKTSEGEIKVYEAGDEWSPDPCTTCHCVETGDGKMEQMCAKIYCDIPICETGELKWSKDACCPSCADECTHRGTGYEIGDSWKPDDCTSCQCYEEDGEKKQMCAMMSCMLPGPNCKPYYVPGECCPRCEDDCSLVDCASTDGCLWEVVQLKGDCCPLCLKPCYSVEDGELIFHKENEPWQDTPCRTCTCVRDEKTGYRNECMEIMCDIPICGPESELIYDDKTTCCPYCSDPCSLGNETYDIGQSWKPDRCMSCECIEGEGGTKQKICMAMDCAQPEEGCEFVYSEDACCPICQKPCEMYDGGKTIEYQPGDEWKPDACTFCYCGLNGEGEKEQSCAVADCWQMEEDCVPVYKEGECCPICEKEVCELKPYIDNGKAVDKAGTGKDASYTFKCDDGYRLQKESGNTAFCNKIGQAVYPVCEKLSIRTRLVEQAAPGTYILEIATPDSTGAAGKWGLLCDDGWSDREAQLVCKQHGYNFGRAVSLQSDRVDFLFTQMYCPRDDDFLFQHCSVTRYTEAKLPCAFNEVAGLFCYNAAFEYRLKDNIKASWSKKTISLIFEVSALKYGKPLDLKRGIFKLDPSDFTISSIKSSSKATKARVRVNNGVAAVRMKMKKPKNFQTSDCISLRIKGPSPEYDYFEEKICNEY